MCVAECTHDLAVPCQRTHAGFRTSQQERRKRNLTRSHQLRTEIGAPPSPPQILWSVNTQEARSDFFPPIKQSVKEESEIILTHTVAKNNKVIEHFNIQCVWRLLTPTKKLVDTAIHWKWTTSLPSGGHNSLISLFRGTYFWVSTCVLPSIKKKSKLRVFAAASVVS